LLAAPRRSAIVAGYAIAAVVRWVFTGAVVTAVAVIAGIEVSGDGTQLAGVVLLCLLLNVAGLL